MSFYPVKEEPMAVDGSSEETSRLIDQSQQRQQQTISQNQNMQQHPIQQQILQSEQPQPLPSIQPLQQQQQPQESSAPPQLQSQHQGQQLPTPDENNLRPSEQSQRQSSHTSQEQQNPDTQKIPTFSGVNNPTPTMTKGNILEAIKDFDSSIPDAVVHHFLNVAGMQTSDQRIVRLIAIAAQKFIHDIVSDSLQHCKLRGAQNKKTKEKKYTLTMDDLGSALAEYGIEVKRQLYFN